MAGIMSGQSIGSRLQYQNRLKSALDDSRRDYRSGGILVALEGLSKRFHDNNFNLLGLSRS
jgi:hypothetical protein